MLGVVSGEELTRFVYTAFSALNSLSLVKKMSSFLLDREGIFHTRDLVPVFRGTKEGQGILLTSAVSQVISIQNNLYASVAYFKVTYSEPLHIQTNTTKMP